MGEKKQTFPKDSDWVRRMSRIEGEKWWDSRFVRVRVFVGVAAWVVVVVLTILDVVVVVVESRGVGIVVM